MSKDEFRTVVKALITHKGDILIGQKEDDEDHEIGGKWHVLGGHLEKGEQVEEAMEREVKEETGLEVDVHQIVDTSTFSCGDGEKDSLQIFFHCEADSRKAEAEDDLQDLKWVEPDELVEEVHEDETERLKKRDSIQNFIEKLKKMPVV
jgi:8-oxo-dGTP diphosphatase